MTEPPPAVHARTALFTAVDQALSSGTNFAANILAVALLTDENYGRFSLVLATYFFALGVGRSLALEPLLVRPSSDASSRAWARRLVLSAGSLVGVVVAIVGVVMSRGELLLLGFLFPALVGVEYLRLANFQRRTPHIAAVADAGWALGMLVAFLILILAASDPSAVTVVLVWAIPAALIGAFALGKRPGELPSRSARREHLRLGLNYSYEHFIYTGALYLITLLVGFRLGTEALGYYGAARAAYGPVNSGLSAFHAYFLPRYQHEKSAPVIGLSGLRGGLVMGVVTLVIALATRSGEVREWISLLGDAAPDVAPLLWPMGLFVSAQALIFPARSVLRRLSRERWVTRVQAVHSALLIGVAVWVLRDHGLERLIETMTVVAFALSVLWWLVVAQAVKKPGPAWNT